MGEEGNERKEGEDDDDLSTVTRLVKREKKMVADERGRRERM